MIVKEGLGKLRQEDCCVLEDTLRVQNEALSKRGGKAGRGERERENLGAYLQR